MSTIRNIPTWAQSPAEEFRTQGRLSGPNVNRQSIPTEALDEFQSQLFGQIDQIIAMDESPMDLARPEPNKVRIEEPGIQITAHYTGNRDLGEIALESQGELNSGAFGEFTAEKATLVQTMKVAEGQYGTIAAFVDRSEPARSFIETRDLPEGFNFFGG